MHIRSGCLYRVPDASRLPFCIFDAVPGLRGDGERNVGTRHHHEDEQELDLHLQRVTDADDSGLQSAEVIAAR